MNMKKFWMVCASLAFSISLRAEPVTLFGLSLNQPVDLSACPLFDGAAGSDLRSQLEKVDETCISRHGNQSEYGALVVDNVWIAFSEHEKPDLSLERVINARLDGNDRLIHLEFDLYGGLQEQEDTFAMLVTLFGQPTERHYTQEGDGDWFRSTGSLNAKWLFNDGDEILFTGEYSELEKGYLIVSSRAMAEAAATLE